MKLIKMKWLVLLVGMSLLTACGSGGGGAGVSFPAAEVAIG